MLFSMRVITLVGLIISSVVSSLGKMSSCSGYSSLSLNHCGPLNQKYPSLSGTAPLVPMSLGLSDVKIS